MKKALFIGITEYDLENPSSHLQKKFEGLSAGMKIFVIARGGSFYKKKWNADFYLVRFRPLFLPVALVTGCYICATKKVDAIVCRLFLRYLSNHIFPSGCKHFQLGLVQTLD